MQNLHLVTPSNRSVSPPKAVDNALLRGLGALEAGQRPDGGVAGETIWCTMIPAQVAIAAYLTGQTLPEAHREGLLRHFDVSQNVDGGFGLYDGSRSYLYVTALTYVGMRLLGRPPEHERCIRARAWLAAHDVATIPTWGKLWLAMTGLYDYDGINPIPPEIWLLPKSAPVHPRRFYCHTRLIYLGFSYLYGVRFRGPDSDTIRALRGELYPHGYEGISFRKYRSEVDPNDRFVERDPALEAVYALAGAVEPYIPQGVRERALEVALDRIVYEQRASRFCGISPVNGLLATIALFDAEHADFPRSWAGIEHWAWDDPERGRRYAGAASNTWDSAFAGQAIASGPLAGPGAPFLGRLNRFLLEGQVREDLEDAEKYDRAPIRGGYCFGVPTHRWPVSDCTAEALSAQIAIQRVHPVTPGLPDAAVIEAVTFILARQNSDGGFSSYEPQRGGRLLEHVNPSEMFGNCMGEYSYLECTSSCIQGLAHVLGWPAYAKALPTDLTKRATRAVVRGARYIERQDDGKGAFPGFWGVNFTYGALFATAGLEAVGRPSQDPVLERASRFLLEHRLPDGGWGEDIQSSAQGRYIPAERSQVIMTAWAMLALLRGRSRTPETEDALRAGARLLLERQQSDGNWPVEGIAGVFFDTAGLHYDLYRLVFPLWALGLFAGRGLKV